MATHHRSEFNLACPTCGKAGRVEVVEEAGPPFDAEPRREYRPDDGFELKSVEPLVFVCRGCEAQIARPA